MRVHIRLLLIQPAFYRHAFFDMIIHLHERTALDFIKVDVAPLRHFIVTVEALEAVSLAVFADFGHERFCSRRIEITGYNRVLLHAVSSADFRSVLYGFRNILDFLLEKRFNHKFCVIFDS